MCDLFLEAHKDKKLYKQIFNLKAGILETSFLTQSNTLPEKRYEMERSSNEMKLTTEAITTVIQGND